MNGEGEETVQNSTMGPIGVTRFRHVEFRLPFIRKA